MAITKLTKCGDIASEFAVALHEAGRMKWYYDNKNPNSPVQPVMAGGKLKDWIGYDHKAVKPFIQFTVPAVSFPANPTSAIDLLYSASNTIRVKSSNVSGWCSISIGTQYVNFSAQVNYGSARSGSVVFETVDGLATSTVTVTQAATTVKPNITLYVQLIDNYSAMVRSSAPVKDTLTCYLMYSIMGSTQGPISAIINAGTSSASVSIYNPNYQTVDAIGIESINNWPGDGTYIYETANAKYYFS